MSALLSRVGQGLILMFLYLASSMVTLPAAHAAEQPNVLVMGDDADTDTVPRHSRVFNRVSDAIVNRMIEMGFKVYNETATTMDITNAARVRRTDAELITVAQAITDTPIDVAVVFQIYASAQGNSYSDIKQLRIRIVGRMLQVQSGRDLGNFEVSVGPKGLKPIPSECDRDCILERVGDEAKPVANEVGSVLAAKLDAFSPVARKSISAVTATPKTDTATNSGNSADCAGLATAYALEFTGFENTDIDLIEKVIVGFPGFQHLRPMKTAPLDSIYWYETCSDLTRLERNLRTMAEQFPGHNLVSLVGNKFEIDSVPGETSR